MNIGHRLFIVEENTILPLSQKAFNDLQSGKAGILSQYAGQSLLIAIIIYTIHQRKPQAIIQMDCDRIRILGNGSIDRNHEQQGLHLAANRISRPETKPRISGSVVDATARFEERQWNVRHPKLSGLAYQRILKVLFK